MSETPTNVIRMPRSSETAPWEPNEVSKDPDEAAWEKWFGDGAPEYSPHICYTFASTEKKGLGKPINFRLPAWFMPELEKVVDGVADYEGTVSALCRDALYHRLKYWESRGLITSPEWRGLESTLRAQERVARFRRWVDIVRETLMTLREAKDRHGLKSYIQEQTLLAAEAPEPWRSRILAEIRRRPSRF